MATNKEILDLGKGGMKDLGSAVGMPDDEDKELIRRMVLKYEKKNPGYIQNAIDSAREELAQSSTIANDKLDLGIVDKGKGKGITSSANRALVFELPEDLYSMIETAYPTMFRDRKHFQWFVKNFRELVVPNRYIERKGFFKK